MKINTNIVYRRLSLAFAIGIATGILRFQLAYQIAPLLGNGGGDFSLSTLIARDLYQGQDPYRYSFSHDAVPYPLPAGLIAMPFALLPDELASAIFFGLSSFILSWCLLKNGRTWPLLIFLSWPFAYAIMFCQWTPLITAIWFMPFLMPMVLVKPHIALPLVLTGRVTKNGVLLTLLLLVVSLIIYPTWPLAWFEKTGTYRGTPPLFSLPLGPLLLLALFKYRDRRAWLLVLLALMPQRVLYDQLPLFLIAASGVELTFLIMCSWMTLPVLFLSGGWSQMPVSWQFWIVLTLYLPALIILFLPNLSALFKIIYSRIHLDSRLQQSRFGPNRPAM